MYNFDEIINRYNTNSIKYDFADKYGMPKGLIPLWIADMDFKTAPCITEALIKTAGHSIFGYSEVHKKGPYFEAVRSWFFNRFNFDIEPDWLVKTPGVVFALNAAVRAFTEPGEAVIIQTPVYPPFKTSVESNRRRLVTNSLLYVDGKYEIDFVDFEKKIISNNVKLFILCSPHNPVGRVWTKEELSVMGEICQKHGVIVLSDEIHCDFVYGERKHIVFGSINDEFLKNSVICTSPSKTFNLGGLQLSNIFIENSELRHRFNNEIEKTGCELLNQLSLTACLAAYEEGGGWLLELLVYIEKNYNYVSAYINDHLPDIRLAKLEGTYLIWLDMNRYGYSEAELNRLLVNEAGLWVSNGASFGREGKGFVRINIACPLSTLEKAFNRLNTAINRI